MNDVFDEELMKELGLDPDEVAATPKPGNAPARKPVPPPAAGAVQPQQTAAPRAPAPQRPAPPPRPPVPAQRAASPQQTEVEAHEINTAAHALRMTENLPVQLAAVLAKKTILLKDIVDLRVGEIVDFKKAPQEPLDLVANGKLIAKAEMVLVDGRLGAKIVKLVK
jgi:flagellar motor switch protein FliN/FliY